AVLAHDSRQSAQIPFAGHRGRHHETPPDHFTPAVPAWPSAEHRIAAVNTGRTHWHPGRKHPDDSETAMAGKAVGSAMKARQRLATDQARRHHLLILSTAYGT